MTKTEQLNRLFNEWLNNRSFEIFCKDGIIDEEQYSQERIKILFVLKDLHLKYEIEKHKKSGSIDMREYICTEGGMWNTVESWAQPFFDDISQGKALERVAFLNLKKEYGESSVNDKCVLRYAKRDSDFIKKQIQIINPDIIIACSNAAYNGLREVFKKQVDFDGKITFNDKMKNYGEYFDISAFLDSSKHIFVVHYRHPSRSNIQGTLEQHQQNMLKIKETLSGN